MSAFSSLSLNAWMRRIVLSVTSARSTFFVGHRLKQRLRPLLAGGERVDHLRPQSPSGSPSSRRGARSGSSGCRSPPARGRPRPAPRRPRPCGPCSAAWRPFRAALIAPSCRTASARASAARPVFAAVSTARLSAAGSRKLTASLFASADELRVVAPWRSRPGARPSPRARRRSARRARRPARRAPSRGWRRPSASRRTRRTASGRRACPVATSRRMTFGTIWSRTNSLSGACSASHASSLRSASRQRQRRVFRTSPGLRPAFARTFS